jgi:hypothetical protein
VTGGGTQCRTVETRAGIFDENTQREEGWMGVDENMLFYAHFIGFRVDGIDAERNVHLVHIVKGRKP